MQQSNLNLIPSGDMPVIYASQYDKNRVIRFNLFDGDDEYILTGTETVKCNIRKNDEHIVVITPVIGANKYIDIYLTEQACACFGPNIGEITISSDEDTLIGTINFILEVERNPIQGGVTSESDIDDLTGQIEDIVHEVMSDDYYTRDEVDAKLDLKANTADVYTKSEVDTALSSKANAADVYTKTQVDTALGLKADKSDTYTKSQVDTALALKADASSVYTKSEVDAALASKANASDVYTKTEVDEIIEGLYPVNSASGSIATFSTSLALPLVECKAEIVAQQAGTGTPTPQNVRSISGFSSVNFYQRGVNLWDEEWEVGQYSNVNGSKINANDRIRSKNFIPVAPNTEYYFNISTQFRAFWYDINKNYISYQDYNATVKKWTSPVNACYFTFNTAGAYGTTYNNDISINYPSTDTSYHAYNAQSETKTIALGQTVYGGSVDCIGGRCLNSGAKLTLDGNISASDLRITAQTGYTRVEWYPYRDIGKGNETFKSDKFVFNTETGLYRVSNYNSTTTPRMFFGLPDTVTTREEAIAWFASNPTEIVYELATPQEITGLTPANFTTIAGEQNIFADCGDVEVSFKQNIQEYIDDKLGG